MALNKRDIVNINLNTGNIHRSFMNHTIGHKDTDADQFGVRVFRDGEEVDLDGVQCQAVFMAPDGTNIALTQYGTVSGNVAYVTLPQACYNVEGQFCLAIKLIGDGVTGTVRIIDGVVDRTGATGTVAPTTAVPTYQEVLAAYNNAIAAVDDVNELKIEIQGRTLASPSWERGRYTNDTGEKTSNNDYIRTKAKVTYDSQMAIIISNHRALNVRIRVYFYSDTEFISATGFITRSFRMKDIIPDGTVYFNITVTGIGGGISSIVYGDTVLITDWHNTLLPTDDALEQKIQTLNKNISSENTSLLYSSEKTIGAGMIILSDIGLNPTAVEGSVSEFDESLTNYRSAKIKCSEGDSFVITAKGSGGIYRPWAFLNSNNIVLSRTEHSEVTDEVAIAPANAAYFVVNNNISTKPNGYYAYKNNYAPSDTITGLIGRNAFPLVWEAGRYDPSTGEKTTSESHIRTTEKFAYSDNLAIIVKNIRAYNTRYRVSFYDSSDAFIDVSSFLTRGCMLKDIAPIGTATFAISVVPTSGNADLSYGLTIQVTRNYNTFMPPDSELQSTIYGNRQFAPVWISGGINKDDGSEGSSTTFIKTRDYIPYSSDLIIVLTNQMAKLRFRVFYYKYANNNEGSYLGFSGDQSASFHRRGIRLSDYAPEETAYFRIAVTTSGSGNPSIEMGYTVAITDGKYALLPLDSQIIDMIDDLKEQGIDQLPDYYGDYLRTKAKQIVTRQNSLSVNSIQFFLISDYHTRTNQGHSKAMINKLSAATGITMLCYTGDGGGSLGSSDDKRLESIIRTSEVWDGLEKSIKEYYGTLGNHEWITATYFHRTTVTNMFLGRYKNTVLNMEPTYGSYCVDNKFNKVRYYFLQCTSSAVPNGYTWMANDLLTLPEGYNVAVFMHHGAIPGEASKDEYDGVVLSDDGDQNVYARLVANILHKFETHDSITISNVTYDYSARTGNDAVIGIFCGHYHHGTMFDRNHELNAYNVMVFRASTDSLQAASVAVDRTPWYWENGVVGGTKIVREADTINEQCFYAIQIDLDTKDVYITGIGGDHDWETNYGEST